MEKAPVPVCVIVPVVAAVPSPQLIVAVKLPAVWPLPVLVNVAIVTPLSATLAEPLTDLPTTVTGLAAMFAVPVPLVVAPELTVLIVMPGWKVPAVAYVWVPLTENAPVPVWVMVPAVAAVPSPQLMLAV